MKLRALFPPLTLTGLMSLMLAGCAVGPDYKGPPAPVSASGWFVDPAANRAASGPADTQWWRLFDDPTLDRLVAEALAHNTDVRQAAANLQQARAVLSEARSGRLPTTDLSAAYRRQRVGVASITAANGAGGGVTPGAGTPDHFDFDFFQVGLDTSYEVDLFGRVSRSIEASRGDAEAAAADLDAARIAVAAETARVFALACSNGQRAAVATEIALLQDRTLDLTRRLLRGGRGTQREVDQATTVTENARAQVPTFEAERRASLYALTVLTGRPPAEVDAAATQCVVAPRVERLIPIGDARALLARRPDVRAAERRLAAQTARIGVATAALYPSISLAGSATLGAQNASDIGKGSSFGFSLGPLISWSFPNVSVARSRIRQAEAGTASLLATFDGTVLTALSETEQALARYAGALDRDAALTRAAAAADNAARLSRLRFDTGRDSFLQLLDSERERASARASLAQSRGAVADAQVALFKALGGGWEDAPPVATGSAIRTEDVVASERAEAAR